MRRRRGGKQRVMQLHAEPWEGDPWHAARTVARCLCPIVPCPKHPSHNQRDVKPQLRCPKGWLFQRTTYGAFSFTSTSLRHWTQRHWLDSPASLFDQSSAFCPTGRKQAKSRPRPLERRAGRGRWTSLIHRYAVVSLLTLRKLTHPFVQLLLATVSRHNNLYLDELRDVLEERCGVVVTESTIWRTLQRADFE